MTYEKLSYTLPYTLSYTTAAFLGVRGVKPIVLCGLLTKKYATF